MRSPVMMRRSSLSVTFSRGIFSQLCSFAVRSMECLGPEVSPDDTGSGASGASGSGRGKLDQLGPGGGESGAQRGALRGTGYVEDARRRDRPRAVEGADQGRPCDGEAHGLEIQVETQLQRVDLGRESA